MVAPDRAIAVAVAAHPDDETLFAGGYLARLAAQGYDVRVIGTTRGEGGEVGEPPVGPKADLGEFREREMRAAVAALGGTDVIFLGYLDPYTEIGGALRPVDVPFPEFAAAIAAQLDRLRPELIITHGTNGEYGHPQHLYTHRGVRAALELLRPWQPARFVTWCARTETNAEDRLTNKDDPADEVLDLTGTPELARKIAASYCYGSQHAMIRRNNPGRAIHQIVRRVEAVRQWPLPLPPLSAEDAVAAPGEAAARAAANEPWSRA